MTDEELAEHGGRYSQLVCGRGRSFVSEFSELLQNPYWAAVAVQSAEAAGVPDMASPLLELCVGLHCHHAAALQRRVVLVVSERRP